MQELIKLYSLTTHGDPIPYMEIRGNKSFVDKFDGDMESLYAYCIEHKQKWEDVLGINLEVFSDVNNLT